ncbi:MAG TPA: D-alanyl-D-alanine carboxypeptidase/D-alanyl-D-alanine-endopeptidase [Candidatus Acidoferrales bacterium]|nr:D-alanyl-D-alanine carboxypeptidase/D-alanyl-D-alanine-endopeptidase [Candidatus Acidoferrales bacterium]
MAQTSRYRRFLYLSALCLFAPLLIAASFAQGPARRGNSEAGASTGVASFRARVEKILAAPEPGRGYWGMLVEDADTGEVLFSLNSDKYFLPASNAKLFTAALALATLGPDYRFRTTIEARAPLNSEGLLQGDLILVGRGDPNLSNRVFPFVKKTERDGPPEKALAELADAVVARGVKQISGDIVADDSYLAGGTYPSGWAIDDMLWNYGVPVSALQINDGILLIELTPGRVAGSPATYTAVPLTDTYRVHNEVMTAARGSVQKLSVEREPGSSEIFLRGSMPLDAAPHSMGLAIDRPAEFASALLKSLLEARGVVISGHARAVHSGDPSAYYGAAPTPTASAANSVASPAAAGALVPGATVLAEHISPPLSDDLRVMLKTSQNLHAEMLLRVSARAKTGDSSEDTALQFEEDFRKGLGLSDADVVMTDASGLSRKDMVTPQSEVTLLRWAGQQPWAEIFRSALPLAGEDGTLMDRMKGTPAAGHVWAKTGSLTHVDSLAGYATSSRGEHLVFSFLGNNHNLKSKAATDVLDSLAVAMVEELGNARCCAGHK